MSKRGETSGRMGAMQVGPIFWLHDDECAANGNQAWVAFMCTCPNLQGLALARPFPTGRDPNQGPS